MDHPNDTGGRKPLLFLCLITFIIATFCLTASCTQGSITATTSLTTSTTTTASVPTTTQATTSATAELTWGRVADKNGVFSGAGMQVVSCVIQGGPGLLVAGGSESNGEADAAVWLSADGLDWTRVPDEEDILGGKGIQLINSVTKGGPGYVAVGQDDPEGSPEEGWVDSDAAVWVSVDGSTWKRVLHDEAVFGGPGGQRMMSVTAGGPGLVAVGSDYKDSSGWPDVAVWVSADGFTWVRVPDQKNVFGGPAGQEALAVTALGSKVVAVGSAESYANAAVWVSADGYAWNRVPHDEALFGGRGDQEMVAVVKNESNLVAVGADSSNGDDDVAVWTSADGYAWTRVQQRETLGGSGNQSANCMAVWEKGLLLIGIEESGGYPQPAVWSSSDGSKWTRAGDESAPGGPNQEFSSLTAWQSGLVAVGRDDSGQDTDGAVWMSPPPAKE